MRSMSARLFSTVIRACLPFVKKSLLVIGRRHLRESRDWKGFELDGAERMPSALPLAGAG